MSDRTPEENLAALNDVVASYERLAARGLAIDSTTNRGLNADGMTTLGDLLSVLTFQAGAGETHTERVLSASARATLTALADLFGSMAGQDPSGDDTLRLLREAIKAARARE